MGYGSRHCLLWVARAKPALALGFERAEKPFVGTGQSPVVCRAKLCSGF